MSYSWRWTRGLDDLGGILNSEYQYQVQPKRFPPTNPYIFFDILDDNLPILGDGPKSPELVRKM